MTSMSSERSSLWARLIAKIRDLHREEELPPGIKDRITPRGSLMKEQRYP
jgi:hypothetical protein